MKIDQATRTFRLLCLTIACLAIGRSPLRADEFRAGAAVVDVTPRTLPVIRNGGFLEAVDDRVVDPLHARCLVFSHEDSHIALVVVDSCMIPRDFCDRAKQLAHKATSIPLDRMLIAATHTHSAPSVMDYCLGSRADTAYRDFLPAKIAEAIELAHDRLQPAVVGWATVDAGDATNCRRWITRPDAMLVDPFGNQTVRAMMHPGHENLNYVGPSGPIDPWLSILSVRGSNGVPLAILANFSMHYFGGHPGVSSDYYGRFCRGLADHFRPENADFVAIMSQGTSGDLWWGDYSRPSRPRDIDEYTGALVERVLAAEKDLPHEVPARLEMVERRMTMNRRTPSAERLAWARRKLALLGDLRPRDQPEVYAEQADYLSREPTEEIVLQAICVGDVALTAMPNEVFGLTGLKLKAQSPFERTMNLELANGASGYIPPPEQHALGGYTTWPARTAGLEVEAEPRIVAQLLEMLEAIAQRPRRVYAEPEGYLAQTLTRAKPWAYWRTGEQTGDVVADSSGHQRHARIRGAVAYHLPGAEGIGLGAKYDSRAIQLAGGSLTCNTAQFSPDYTLEVWCWNGLVPDSRDTTGVLWSHGSDQLVLSGKRTQGPPRLMLGDRLGRTTLERHRWHHVALVRNGRAITVYLNGADEPEITADADWQPGDERECVLGAAAGGDWSWEGRLDEIVLFDRPLSVAEIQGHYHAAVDGEGPISERLAPDSPPLDAAESMRKIHVPAGYRVELVACEPMVQDPVAIDWGPDGKLWVAEMADYPSGLDNRGQAGGRIRCLEDTDRDGHYDRSTVFLDRVSFPNGVMAWRDGVLVTAAPEIFFARDRDGDRRADERVTLYSGFLAGNQQLRVNGLRWGLDNWVHCANGGHHAGYGTDSSIWAAKPGQRIPLGSRDLRIDPDTGRLEPESGPSQFGRVRDDRGNWFGVQNSYPLWHYVLEDRYLARNGQVAAPDVRHQVRTPANPEVFAIKAPEKRYHSFEQAGHFTSACGIDIYRDSWMFARHAGEQHAFTCEPFHNLVQHHVLRDAGISFVGRRADDDGPYDFFVSADRWCRPVMARTGPDGALWIVDMYRYMIEHPEWLPQEGKDELRPFYRAGAEYGRIYRIVPEKRGPREVIACSNSTSEELVGLLNHESGVVRDWAHRLLIERRDLTVVPQLSQQVRSSQSVWGRLHSLAVLDGLQDQEPAVLGDALRDSEPAIQRLAVRIVERWPAWQMQHLQELLSIADHSDATVRLQLACTLGEVSGDEAALSLLALVRRANHPLEQAAVVSSMPRHLETIVRQLTGLTEHESPQPEFVYDAVFAMTASRPDLMPDVLDALLPKSLDNRDAASLERLGRCLDQWARRGMRIDELEANADDRMKRSVLRLTTLIDAVGPIVRRPDVAIELRLAAARLLGYRATVSTAEHETLLSCVDATQPAALQLAAIAQLTSQASHETARVLLDRWRSYSPDVRAELIDRLLARPELTRTLMEYCVSDPNAAQQLGLAQRDRLMRHADRGIGQAARKLFTATVLPERARVVARYLEETQGSGMIAPGRAVFEQQCATCHRPATGETAATGPDLRTLTDRSTAGLVRAILDPSGIVEPKFVAYTVTLADGEVLQGIIASETANSFELKLSDGKHRTVLRDAIEQVASTGRSLMPDGLEILIAPAQMRDLVAYMQAGLPDAAQSGAGE